VVVHPAPRWGALALHPASVLKALDDEATAWATETGLDGVINALSEEPRTREVLTRLARQCFVEGLYRGALNVIDGKPLFVGKPPADHAQGRAREEQDALDRLNRWKERGDGGDYGVGDLRFERDVLALLILVTEQQEAMKAAHALVDRAAVRAWNDYRETEPLSEDRLRLTVTHGMFRTALELLIPRESVEEGEHE